MEEGDRLVQRYVADVDGWVVGWWERTDRPAAGAEERRWQDTNQQTHLPLQLVDTIPKLGRETIPNAGRIIYVIDDFLLLRFVIFSPTAELDLLFSVLWCPARSC